MPFPLKFKKLIETDLKDVEAPDYIWLNYAVCACDTDSCGWGGWIIEAAYKILGEKEFPTGTGDSLLNADYRQVCPRCGKGLFRTGASVRYTPSADQTPVHGMPGIDYDVAEIQYEE